MNLHDLTFLGMRIIQSPYLEQDGEPVQVRRSWRERLFTRPWRPLVKTRTVVPRIPHRGAIQLDANTLVMHPATYHRFRRQLETGVAQPERTVNGNRREA